MNHGFWLSLAARRKTRFHELAGTLGREKGWLGTLRDES